MSATYLRAAKDIFLFSGLGALYSLQMNLSKTHAQALIGITAISRLANRLLLEYVRHGVANLARIEPGRKEILVKKYAYSNALVNLVTIFALRNFQLIGNKGTGLFGLLAMLNVCRIKLTGKYNEEFEDLHRN